MESMFASLEQLRRQPNSSQADADDWKWVLRSAAGTRPVLQWDESALTAESNSGPTPKILLQSLWRSDSALKFRLRADPRLWLWSLRFLANCTTARNQANTLRKLSLCLYSQAELTQLARDAGIDYDAIRAGLLYLFREPAHFETGQANMRLLQDHGLDLQAIDPARIAALEPALAAAQGKFAGAIYAPSDESGDCLKFTQGLADAASANDSNFHNNSFERFFGGA